MRTFAVHEAHGMQENLARALHAHGFGHDHPAIRLLRKRKGIEQRRPLTAVRASDLAAIQITLLVNFWLIESIKQCTVIIAVLPQSILFLLWQVCEVEVVGQLLIDCRFEFVAVFFKCRQEVKSVLCWVFQRGDFNAGGYGIEVICNDMAAKALRLEWDGATTSGRVKYGDVGETFLDRIAVGASISI